MIVKTFTIAVAALGFSYGFSFAQSVPGNGGLTDQEYLDLANSEAFGMFAEELSPLAPRAAENVYILGLEQTSSSFFCALDVVEKIEAMIDTNENGIMFVQVSDVAFFVDSPDCIENQTPIKIISASYQGY